MKRKSLGFVLRDGLDFVRFTAQALADNEFSRCFVPAKPKSRLFLLLLPRLLLLLGSSAIFFVFLLVPSKRLQRILFRLYCKAFLLSWGAKITFHGSKPQITSDPHVFVANHTSIIDYIILSSHKFPHATVAQKQQGLLGFFLDYILSLNGSLSFSRSDKQDRSLVFKKLYQHVHDTSKSPLLIFPEGTCVNNKYTVLFHKGAFELDAIVCPVAIKYDKSSVDAYWHSREQSFTSHILSLMSNWSLKADVWFLPPRCIKPGQSPIEFANQVKLEISKTAGLKNLSWDGYFKNYCPEVEKEDKMKLEPRKKYGRQALKQLGTESSSNTLMKRSYSMEVISLSDPRLNKDSLQDEQNAFLFPPKNVDASQFFLEQQEVDIENQKNKILIALQTDESQDPSHAELIRKVAGCRNNVVSIWKNSTKLKNQNKNLMNLKGFVGINQQDFLNTADFDTDEDFQNQRIEHSTWRLWFKQRQREAQDRAMNGNNSATNNNVPQDDGKDGDEYDLMVASSTYENKSILEIVSGYFKFDG